MNDYREEYGDAVENNEKAHAEALRRAHNRNVNDMNTYSAVERAPAGPAPQGQLNWAGGNLVMTPSHVPSEELTGLHSSPRVDAGMCGVDAICGFTNGGY
jgi:hypothetical protein